MYNKLLGIPYGQMRFILLLSIIIIGAVSYGQTSTLSIKVKDSIFRYNISGATIVIKSQTSNYSASFTQTDTTDSKGSLVIENIPFGSYRVSVAHDYHGSKSKLIEVKEEFQKLKFFISDLYMLGQVNITPDDKTLRAITIMKTIDGMFSTSGKKTTVIAPDKLDLNEGTANPRQVYQSIPGLNIWESDGAGIQLGIGGRGLSPNRTSNFNSRQNGYDISADALGYPETYYTPPLEAVEKIQLIRGAASLQFGTQFGGMLNFVLKQGGEKPLAIEYKKTMGSNALSTNFISAGGKHRRWNYYAFVNHKSGNDFRPNSKFDVWSGHVNSQFHFNDNNYINAEYTRMEYLTQQAGGLTDAQFEDDPLQSNRDRNWFNVKWNLASVSFRSSITPSSKFETKFFGLMAERKALGYLGSINRIDPIENRDLIWGSYLNWGNETRFIKSYDFREKNIWILLIGARYYSGYSTGEQGDADDGYGANFRFINNEASDSKYNFPSKNFSLFAEHIFRLGKHWSITPGARFEHIDTRANGVFWNRVYDGANNLIYEQEVTDARNNQRSFVLAGIGVSYKRSDSLEVYGNFSQNYRSINFTDMQINNPNFRIDPNLKDERGFNADIGIRGNLTNFLHYDVSAFYLQYSDRIGILSLRDSLLFNVYQYRTNIADSRTLGVESFISLNLLHWLKPKSKSQWLITSNLAFIQSQYFNSENTAIEGKLVEHVPAITAKLGMVLQIGKVSSSFQFSYVSEQFTDATNATSSPTSVIGLIPSYYIADWSSTIRVSSDFKVSFGINNLFNQSYFTRRAGGYPGPGIIPSSTRNVYVSLGLKI
ncbi:MAG: TonB-dependent receptor [Flavobacteriales bacterium]|nr:TonB-dependent receptor [Flavobacteriales bacterium]